MVMNKQKQLFGVVDNVEENKDYTGVKTETAEVKVNNTKREISVDVDFQSMLGETNKTAYPGDLGAQTRHLLMTNIDNLEKETQRAVSAEENLNNLIEDVDWKVELGDSRVREKLYAEADRAKAAEQQLSTDITDLAEVVQTNKSTLQLQIKELGNTTNSKLNEYSKESAQRDVELHNRINVLATDTKVETDKLQKSINYITENYADKPYVYEQLIEFNKLHKQIADGIDISNNTVVIDGVSQPAQNNVIYLVKELLDSEEIYNQYTLIDNILTFIGSSKIDLSDYATKTYVDNKISKIDLSDYATLDYVSEQIESIPEVYLTPYAKLTDIPDVSEFINEIPPEYITEKELEEKEFLTKELASSDFATKIYVQTELSKIGTLSKEIVDAVDLENNRIILKGESLVPDDNLIYLVKQKDADVYDQYTLVDNKLTFIGTTDMNLSGYATQEYVDESINSTKLYLDTTLKSIEFIDGGTSSSLKI